jgi:peptidoglycan/LPS O-acetylase OafA/YrhL
MPPTRFALFDSLRALAALSVVLFHTSIASKGVFESRWGTLGAHLNVGVALFFLISGFLLYRPYAIALVEGSEPPRLLPYAKRRFLRIVPAYWLALTLLALWPGLQGVLTRDWWVYYGLLQSHRSQWLFGGIAPAWSLSVEVAFYALLPLLAAAIARLASRRSPRARSCIALAALGVLGAGGLVFRAVSLHAGRTGLLLSLPACLLWFAVGMSFAVASARLADHPERSRAARLVIDHSALCFALALAVYVGFCLSPLVPTLKSAALATSLADALGSPTVVTDLAEQVAYAVVAALVMAPAVFGESAGGLPRRLLASPVLAKIGEWSYGIFLWHHPLLGALADRGLERLIPGSPFLSLTVLIVPIAIACGWLSHRLVEAPAMRLGRGRPVARRA